MNPRLFRPSLSPGKVQPALSALGNPDIVIPFRQIEYLGLITGEAAKLTTRASVRDRKRRDETNLDGGGKKKEEKSGCAKVYAACLQRISRSGKS